MAESVDHDGAGMMKTSRLPVFTHYWDTNAQSRGTYIVNKGGLGLIVTGMSTGIINLVIFIIFLCCRKIQPKALTVFRVSLAFTHVLQLISSPVIVKALLRDYCTLEFCNGLEVSWFMCRHCGIIHYLLVVLEFMLIQVKCPLSSKFQHLSWNLPVVAALYLSGVLFYISPALSVFMGSVALALACLAVILACIYRQSMDKCLVLAALSAVLTFALTYLPNFVAECMAANDVYATGSVLFLSLTNMRLTADGFLCWVICLEPPEAPQEQSEDGQVDLKPPPYDSLKNDLSGSNS